MASLSDVLSTVQNGVVAFNNLTIQMKGSFNNISSQFAALNVTTSNITLQTVYAELTTFTSGVTNMAAGVDTIPQNTDGTQLLTVSITPKLSTSKLLIRVMMPATNSAIVNMWAGIFQDSTAAALAATAIGVA